MTITDLLASHMGPEDHRSPAGGHPPLGGPATDGAVTNVPSPDRQGYLELRLLAKSFEDALKARIAIGNRVGSGSVDTVVIADALDALHVAETKIALALRRSLRRVAPEIAAWAKNTPGLGEHTVARLVGTIGHPVIAEPFHWEGEGADRTLIADPRFLRNLDKLRAYCGHGDPTRRRRKGMTAAEAMGLGNPRAKMLVHLMAECAMKTRTSPYRAVYDAARLQYADRADWTDGHRHNAALRKVAKEILRDLWIVARQTIPTDLSLDHCLADTQLTSVEADLLHPGRDRDATQLVDAGVDPSASDHPFSDTHALPVAGSTSSDPDHRGAVIHHADVGVADIDGGAS